METKLENQPEYIKNTLLTEEGGYAAPYINGTGAPSVKGSLVSLSDNWTVELTPVDSLTCIGVMYEDGIPDGEECWVVTTGAAEVLIGTNVNAGELIRSPIAADLLPAGVAAAEIAPAAGTLSIGIAVEDFAVVSGRLTMTNLRFVAETSEPVVGINHNDTGAIQGGAPNDYQHLTTDQVAIVDGVTAELADKMELIPAAVEDNLASWDDSGAVKDSGLSIVTAIADPGTDLHIPTAKAARDMFDPLQTVVWNETGSGVQTGMVISINANPAKIDISAGFGHIIDNTDMDNPILHAVAYPGGTAITITNILTVNATYLAINSAGTVIQSITPFTPTQRRGYIILGAAIHSNRIVVNVVNNAPDVCRENISQFNDLADGLKTFSISGNVFSANGANLNINKSDGYEFKKGANFRSDPLSPHTIHLSALTAPSTMRYRLRDGTEYSNTAVIDPGFFDAAGVRTACTNVNRWTIQRLTLFSSNLVRIQYGQAEYQNKADAIQAIQTEAFVVEANIADNGLTRALLVVRAGCTNLSVMADAQFFEVDRFGGSNFVAGGSPTTNMQQAYNNSAHPQITTSAALGSVQIKRGSAADTDIVLEVLNGAGNPVLDVPGNGHMRTYLTGRAWRDEYGDVLTLRSVGTGVSINAAESVAEFTVASDLNDFLYKNTQLNHDRDETAVVSPHVHWFQASNAVPNFLFQYRWQVNGGTKLTPWLNLRMNVPFFTYVSGTIHQLCDLAADIAPPAGSTISDIIQFRLLRDNANTSGAFTGADPYVGTVGVLSVDIHIQTNSLGSTTEYVK